MFILHNRVYINRGLCLIHNVSTSILLPPKPHCLGPHAPATTKTTNDRLLPFVFDVAVVAAITSTEGFRHRDCLFPKALRTHSLSGSAYHLKAPVTRIARKTKSACGGYQSGGSSTTTMAQLWGLMALKNKIVCLWTIMTPSICDISSLCFKIRIIRSSLPTRPLA